MTSTDNARAEAWDEGYLAGYRDRREERDYDPGQNPYRAAGRAETTTEQCEPRLSDYGQDTHCRACGVEHRAETATATDEDMFEQAWEVVARVRDAHPRRVDDAPTEDIVDALIDARLLATARTRPTREQITEHLRQRAIDDGAHADRLDTDDGPSAEEWDRWYDAHLTISHWIDGEALRVEGAPEAIADAVLALLNNEGD